MANAIDYLDPVRVTRVRVTSIPVYRARGDGYGSKIPTATMLQLDGKRWHRVYAICWSNMPTLYIRTKAGPLYLGAYDPSKEG
jgi:hypothetical protein